MYLSFSSLISNDLKVIKINNKKNINKYNNKYYYILQLSKW